MMFSESIKPYGPGPRAREKFYEYWEGKLTPLPEIKDRAEAKLLAANRVGQLILFHD